MFRCIICHFDVELDDVIVMPIGGRCICVACYRRETESELPMPKALRREISAALAEIAGG